MAGQRKRSGGRKGNARGRGLGVLSYLGVAALGAVVALAATGRIAPSQWSLPQWAKPPVEQVAKPEPRPERQSERTAKAEPQRRRATAPDRSIETAACPIPRPQRPVPEKTRERPAPAVARVVPQAAPKPKADIPLPPAQPASSPAGKASQGGKVTRLSGVAFPVCGEAPSRGCVIDGDTFVLDGKAIRIAGIVVPEAGDPKCPREIELADRSRQRLKQILSSGPIELVADTDDRDIYGRKQRTVLRDGQPVGATLIAEGLARPAGSGATDWCR